MGQEIVKLPRSLRGRGAVVIDTMVLIYLFEDSPHYGEVSEFIVHQASCGVFSGAVTPITAAELLVKPLAENRRDIADRYRNAISSMQNVTTIEMTVEIGWMAGALRSKYGLPLPDMMQMACAMQADHPAIVTNDKALRKVKEVDVFTLSDFE